MTTSDRCSQCGQPLPPTGLCPACAADFLQGDPTAAPGRAFVPPSVKELAAHFPQLEILGLIGKGGMGAVYKVRQRELDRIVALKILPPGIGDDPAFASRFAREARALAKLSHPNIVTLYEFGRGAGDGPYFFLMEYVDGVNLRQLLQAERVAPREALEIVPQICDALQYAHDQGIVHRDIKPENILIDRRGRVKVADFGLAKIIGGASAESEASGTAAAEAGATDAGKIMGTPSYMAPEQLERPAEVDHRADIYALGVVFYQMLTGELPGKSLEPPSRKVRIDVRLDEVVLRALEKNPELRYPQASVLKTQVETIAETPPLPPEVPGEDISQDSWRREKLRTAFGTTVLVVCFLMSLCFAVVYPRQAAAPILVMGLSILGLIVAALRIAGVWPFPSLWSSGNTFSSRNLNRTGDEHAGAAQDTWRREKIIISLGAFLFLVCFCFSLVFAVSYPREAVVPIAIMGLGLIVCLIRLAGKWPFPSIWSSGNGFSSRNIGRGAQTQSEEKTKSINTPARVAAGYLAAGCGLLSLFLPWLLAGEKVTMGWLNESTWDLLLACAPLLALIALGLGFFARRLRSGFSGLVLGGLSLATWLVLLFMVEFGRTGAGQRVHKSSPSATIKPPKLQPATFSPAVEVTLPQNAMLDFDTGKEMNEIPKSIQAESDIAKTILDAVAWMEGQGLDVINDTGHSIKAVDLKIRPLNASAWDTLTPEDLRASLDNVTMTQWTDLLPNGKLPATYAFQTRQDGSGILQITGSVDNPSAVKIRYKLLRVPAVDPKAAAMQAVQSWLGTMDGGQYAQAWEQAAPSFQKAVTQDDWIQKSKNIRAPVGKVVSRKVTSQIVTTRLPGMPDGTYFVAEFHTQFEDFPSAKEQVAMARDASGVWQAIAYLILPDEKNAPGVTVTPKTDDERAAVSAAESWLGGIDAGKYAESWTQAEPNFRAAVSQVEWVSDLTTVRAPLGALRSRTLKSVRSCNSLPGAPAGHYVVMQFDASFANKASAIETVTFVQTKDGKWEASGYFIK